VPMRRPSSGDRSEPSRTIRTVIVRPLRTAWTAVGEPLWRSKTLRQPRTPSCRFPQRAIWCKSHRHQSCEEHDRAEQRNRRETREVVIIQRRGSKRSKQRGSECAQDRRRPTNIGLAPGGAVSGSPENEKRAKDPYSRGSSVDNAGSEQPTAQTSLLDGPLGIPMPLPQVPVRVLEVAP